jgi:RNA polymerase sigma-70 factor (ECF subfamily)
MQANSVEATDAVRCTFADHTPLYDAMQQHKTYFFRVANSILRHTEDAEDAVQAAYLSAWTAWASFRGQSSLKTWLTTIVMNKSLSELRSRQRRTWVSIDDDLTSRAEAEWQLSVSQKTPEQQAIRAQAVRRVEQQLASLPPQTRGIVMLRYGNDLSVDEIAKTSGTTRSSVKGHLHRGTKAMRLGAQRTTISLSGTRAA